MLETALERQITFDNLIGWSGLKQGEITMFSRDDLGRMGFTLRIHTDNYYLFVNTHYGWLLSYRKGKWTAETPNDSSSNYVAENENVLSVILALVNNAKQQGINGWDLRNTEYVCRSYPKDAGVIPDWLVKKDFVIDRQDIKNIISKV